MVVEYSHDKDTDMFQVTAPAASALSFHRATSCRDHVSEDCANELNPDIFKRKSRGQSGKSGK